MGGQAGVILNKLNNNQLAKQKTTNYMANNQYELNSIGQDMGIDLSERDGAGGNRYGVPLQFVLADDQYSQSNNYQSADLDDDAANIVDSVASPEPAKLQRFQTGKYRGVTNPSLQMKKPGQVVQDQEVDAYAGSASKIARVQTIQERTEENEGEDQSEPVSGYNNCSAQDQDKVSFKDSVEEQGNDRAAPAHR